MPAHSTLDAIDSGQANRRISGEAQAFARVLAGLLTKGRYLVSHGNFKAGSNHADNGCPGTNAATILSRDPMPIDIRLS